MTSDLHLHVICGCDYDGAHCAECGSPWPCPAVRNAKAEGVTRAD